MDAFSRPRALFRFHCPLGFTLSFQVASRFSHVSPFTLVMTRGDAYVRRVSGPSIPRCGGVEQYRLPLSSCQWRATSGGDTVSSDLQQRTRSYHLYDGRSASMTGTHLAGPHSLLVTGA